ncbi:MULTISPECIES: AI-2E family transporter [Deinococcus]|uniref:AI-2E family transporter n=1 Tax=Deinococcus rufus TaxID=2136097 RepID=A0ABV7ZBW1_9DEIO|nr:AI-2E family transporter [Deinococcus sp. AB2017081]WQE94006.1 AI-2E family transporter [Deinococcus sp. AB2017081]
MSRPPVSIHVINLQPVALTVIGVLLLLLFFSQVAPSLLAITLAIILATALNPLARTLERWMPRAAAGTLTVLLVVVAVLGLAYVAVPPVVRQLSGLNSGATLNLGVIEQSIDAWLDRHPDVDSVVPEGAVGQLSQQVSALTKKMTAMLPSVLGLVAGGLATALVTLVMVVFALGNPVPLVNGVLGAVPPTHRLKAARALAQVLRHMGAWGRATLLIMAVTGTITAGGFLVLGVENWLVFGILAALGELVPTIGPIVATLPPVLFTLAEDPQKALLVLVFVLVFQQLEGFVLAPFLVGGAGQLHPLSVTVGVVLFGGVFGLVGAFLTVPFLIVIKALYQHSYLCDAPDIPDAVAMALISGVVEDQLTREDEARAEAQKAATEARDAALARQMERGELDLEAVLEPQDDGRVPGRAAPEP